MGAVLVLAVVREGGELRIRLPSGACVAEVSVNHPDANLCGARDTQVTITREGRVHEVLRVFWISRNLSPGVFKGDPAAGTHAFLGWSLRADRFAENDRLEISPL